MPNTDTNEVKAIQGLESLSETDIKGLVDEYDKTNTRFNKEKKARDIQGSELKAIAESLGVKELPGTDVIAKVTDKPRAKCDIPAGHHPILKARLGLAYEKIVKTSVSLENKNKYPELFDSVVEVVYSKALTVVRK